MSNIFAGAIMQLLDESTARLRDELKILENQLSPNDGMIISHDGVGEITIYATPSLKAYVPKTYDGWPVKYFDMTGFSFESLLSMDTLVQS